MDTRQELEKRWVLVVDDDATICEIVQMLLEGHGHRVRCAANGREALACMAESEPALVLTDLMMPVMTGAELVAAMRSDARLAGIPVVVMTAWTVEGNALRAEAVLSKPIGVTALMGAVHRWSTSGGEQIRAVSDEVAMRPME